MTDSCVTFRYAAASAQAFTPDADCLLAGMTGFAGYGFVSGDPNQTFALLTGGGFTDQLRNLYAAVAQNSTSVLPDIPLLGGKKYFVISSGACSIFLYLKIPTLS
jgi:hypothetical protein